MKSCIHEFIEPLTVLNHDERFKIAAIDQHRAIKGYFTSQIRPFLDQPSMLDEFITQRKIEDQRDKMDKYEDKLGL